MFNTLLVIVSVPVFLDCLQIYKRYHTPSSKRYHSPSSKRYHTPSSKRYHTPSSYIKRRVIESSGQRLEHEMVYVSIEYFQQVLEYRM